MKILKINVAIPNLEHQRKQYDREFHIFKNARQTIADVESH